jgi:hypothetical protein
VLSFPSVERLAPLVAGVPCVAAVVIYGELSTGALSAVAATGALLAGVGLLQRVGEAAPPVAGGRLPWLIWLTAVMAWEVLTLVDADLPTLSDLADPILAVPTLRGAATVGWLAAGAWLLARPQHQQERR